MGPMSTPEVSPAPRRVYITSSRLKTWSQCHELHRLRYILGFVPSSVAAVLVMGDLAHRALEAWWLAVRAQAVAEAALLAMLEAFKDGQSALEPYDAAKLLAMLRGYHDRWWREASLFEVLDVEVQFTNAVSVGGGVVHTAGKLDVIVRYIGAAYHPLYGEPRTRWGLEHKTSGEDFGPGSTYRKKLVIDPQATIYLEALEAAAGGASEVGGVIFDMLGKPGLRPLRAGKARRVDETPDEYGERCYRAITEELLSPEYYARIVVTRHAAELERARRDLELASIGMNLWSSIAPPATESHPRNLTACQSYGRECEMFDICTGRASLSDTTRFRRLPSVHPELPDLLELPVDLTPEGDPDHDEEFRLSED